MEVRDRKKIAYSDANPVTVHALRMIIDTFGKENWMVTLVTVEGGYHFHAHPSQPWKQDKTQVVCSEKSKRVRVFKNAESALNLARSFGFKAVAVEL